MSVAGKTAVVTGGGTGIGRAIADALEAAGANVITVDVNAATEPTVVWDLGERTPELADRLLDSYGPIELIVNNVGVLTEHRFLELEEQDFDRIFAVNLRGPWFFTKRLVEALVEPRRAGAVLFVSSLHDTFVRRAPHYSASKAAVAMLVKELAWELGPHIRVNAISPGAISTKMADLARDREYPTIALRRLGVPEDMAGLAVALLDDEVSGYVTGANVPVDGGLSLYDWMTG
jgi:NAD(P)-dependent dehydrogenase (short-subunit alcohol dehydrogenase family)